MGTIDSFLSFFGSNRVSRFGSLYSCDRFNINYILFNLKEHHLITVYERNINEIEREKNGYTILQLNHITSTATHMGLNIDEMIGNEIKILHYRFTTLDKMIRKSHQCLFGRYKKMSNI